MSKVRCLAISADDVYLAVWLNTGILYLKSLSHDRTIFKKEIKPKPPIPDVQSLSFSANEQLTITIRVNDKVQILHYSILNGSLSYPLTFGVTRVCLTCLYFMMCPDFDFMLLMNSYSTKWMIRVSLRAYIIRRKSSFALLFGR